MGQHSTRQDVRLRSSHLRVTHCTLPELFFSTNTLQTHTVMSGRRVLMLAVVAAVAVAQVTADATTEDYGCTHNDQCGSNSCCVVSGQYRYIKPRCAPLGTKGSFCISSQTEPSKFGLPFPDYYLVVEAGYNQFCPCQPGLVCYRGECHPEDEVTTHSR
ncbi:hypothetical protein O3P69_010227 [Scylla paramamosain]|uniref:Prokineticin domain-containing protein n=1 Tax=Scylla paramamosain TaxID=85552 RepID=A0AAW0TRI2_SCYPA